MFARACRPSALFLCGFGAVFALVSSGSSEESPPLISESLREPYNAALSKRNELINGMRQPQGPEDQKIMEVAAKWLVQRVTLLSIKSNADLLARELARYQDELERQLITPALSTTALKGNKAFIDQMGKYLAASLKEVLLLDMPDNRSAVLNAALMLPTIARLKQEEVGDLLVQLMKDKDRHDIVKLYAAKAMREFFPAHLVAFADDPKLAQPKFKRDSERLQALVNYIRREGPPPADEGEREVTRYLRREAIISLANIGVPALSALKKNGVVEGPAAYELLRVLVRQGKDAYDPLPSLSERVEAAIGLCHLKDPADEAGYDPSLAVYAVGLCFLDCTSEYSTDYLNFSERKGKNAKSAESKVPTMPWKIQSERFKEGVKELVANSPKESLARKHAQQLERDISKIAESMKSYSPVTLDDRNSVRDRLSTRAPKTGRLYKLKGPEIDPASLQAGPAADTN